MSASFSHGGVTRSVRIAGAVLWTGAALLAVSGHVGTALWLMREEPVAAADEAPPAAIMIELADVPEAVNTQDNEISDAMEDAEASTPAEEVEAPEEAEPEEIADQQAEPEPEDSVREPEPVEEEIVEETEEPVEEDVVRLPDAVDVPLPTPRPKPPAPKREVVKREEAKKPEPRRQKPRPQQQQAASEAKRKASAVVREGSRNAARQSASGVSSLSPARWQSRLMAHLERRKRYPAEARSRRQQGTVYVRFTIDGDGNVGSVSLARSSGYPALDNEVLSLIRRASPVPAPPPGVNRTITAPVRFNLR